MPTGTFCVFLAFCGGLWYTIIYQIFGREHIMTTLTKDAIKKSFMKLLNAKAVNKITVKEIVEDCGINRNSFYYHFDDIPSLIEEILNEQADTLVQVSSRDANIYTAILTAMDFALQNKAAMMHLYNSASKELFERYLNRVANRTVTEYFDVFFKDEGIDEDDKQAIVMYYKSLLVGFVIEWLGNGMKYDLSIQVQRLCELFEGTTEIAVSRCKRKDS